MYNIKMSHIDFISMDKFYEVGMNKYVNKLHHKIFLNNIKNISHKLYDICYDVMTNKKTNVLEFEYILGNVINNNINPYEILFNVFKNYTVSIKQRIQEIYINTKPTNQSINEYFIKEYNDYVDGCMKLKKIFYKLNKFCTNDNKSKSTNIIYLTSNYWFYKNVLEDKYNNNNNDNDNNNHTNFQDLLDFKNINNNENKLMEFVNLLKIFGFYNNFVKSFQSNAILLQENASFDISKNITDMNIYKNIVEQIDLNIRSFFSQKDNLEKIVNNSVNSIKIFSDMKDNINFMLAYRDYLKNRLMNNYNYDIESTLLNSFSINSNVDIFLQMKLLLNDIYNSQQIDNCIKNNKNLKINVVSDKYKDLKLNSIDTSLKYLNEYLWTDLKPKYKVSTPDTNINFYYDIYSKVINVIYKNKKTFDVNYSKSQVNFTLTIGEDKFTVRSNIIQYMIINKILKKHDYSVKNLETDFGLNLADINSDLNSLFTSKLLRKKLLIDTNDILIELNYIGLRGSMPRGNNYLICLET